ncbi:MAG: DUF1648 domain-containing protein [Clostridia bacterium]|nr:DUF1648 domain-containing protein [Clostridia bacterium]
MGEAGKKNKRPVLQLPLTSWEKSLEAISIWGVLLHFTLLFTSWESLPGKIPQHFGVTGAPDAWGGKGTLMILPITTLVMYLLLTIISKYPHTFNYLYEINEKNAEVQYRYARYMLVVLKAEIIWSFLYIEWITIQVALGKAKGLGNMFLPIFLIINFGTIGVYFYKARKER